MESSVTDSRRERGVEGGGQRQRQRLGGKGGGGADSTSFGTLRFRQQKALVPMLAASAAASPSFGVHLA